MNPDPYIDAILPEIITLRRDLHAHPELGYQEFRTAEQVISALRSIRGIYLQTGIAGTGIVATLGGDKPGPAVALRADMDALPMEDRCEKPWASTYPGRAHTCGHDGHTAALVGAARVLGELQDALPHPVKLIFQPAEEGGAGAKKLCEAGVLNSPEVRVIYGMHGWPMLDRGQVGVAAGAMLASSTSMWIRIIGRGGHAAMPQQTVDPVLVAAHIVTALQGIVSRNIDPLDAAVISVTRVEAGTTFNIIPGEVLLSGTVRALSNTIRDLLFERIQTTAQSVAIAFGAHAEITFSDGYPVTHNDPQALAQFTRAISGARGLEATTHVRPVMGGEDFSYYGERVPANFWFLGVREPGDAHQPQLHQPTYDFPDAMLPLAIRLHVLSALHG